MTRLRQNLPTDPAQIREELNRLEREVNAVSNEVRRLSHQLHPAILDHLGLRIALTRLGEDFRNSGAREVAIEVQSIPDDVPSGVATALYRIAQEALRNIAKHASTAAVHITLVGTADSLRLILQDDGPDFAPLDVRLRGGLGLISMHERASLVGGTLQVTSSPGQGTRVEVCMPLHDKGE